MSCARLQEASSVSTRWPSNVTGLVLKTKIAYFYFKRRGVGVRPFGRLDEAPCGEALSTKALVAEQGVRLVRRAPENNRDEGLSREEYFLSIAKNGYNSEGRAPAIVMRCDVNDRWAQSDACYWCYSAATCTAAWYLAREMYPNNVQVQETERT